MVDILSIALKYLHKKGVAIPITYVGRVINSFPLNFMQQKTSYKATRLKKANAAGKTYVLENISRGIITATPTKLVIILTNIEKDPFNYLN